MELEWSGVPHMRLPAAPPVWELEARERASSPPADPAVAPLRDAWAKHHHSKVVELGKALSAQQRSGLAGELMAEAYRSIIKRRVGAGQWTAAAKLSQEMRTTLPEKGSTADKRLFNRIVGQLDKAGKKHGYAKLDIPKEPKAPLFEVSPESGWELAGEQPLEAAQRPDPAWRILSIDASGMWLIDKTGKSDGRADIQCALRRVDRFGALVGDVPLHHPAYRIGASPMTSSIALMDTQGVLQIYDGALRRVCQTNLQEDLHVTEHFRTIHTHYWGDFKSQVRAVDVCPGGGRYLFTLADEAWCCAFSGQAVWGVAMGLNEGWERQQLTEQGVVNPEVDEALRVFGLARPVDPVELKRSYRELAQRYHPDRNPDDASATQRMQEINGAFRRLTGVDPETLGAADWEGTVFAKTSPDYVLEAFGVQVAVVLPGIAQDWVYAASFAASDGGAYVATYSGKVILLSAEGRAQRVYEIGTCPTQIHENGPYTYFVTSTRLYILEDRARLLGVVDMFEQGRFVATAHGFGLLGSHRLQWFGRAGEKKGEVMARDPIRQLHASEHGTIITTRQHRVEVRGLRI